MSIYIQKMTDDVTLLDGDMPLSPKQIEQLVALILRRLEQNQETKNAHQEMTQLRSSARPE
ncbi:MAG: hypothetical protein AAF490_27135 [Chloroflexota bacterium]